MRIALVAAGLVVLAASAAGASDRTQYIEDPAETDAPVQCLQPPSVSLGPVFIGGGVSGCGSASISGDTVRHGGTVSGTTDLCNPHGGADRRLGWDSGQEHEVTVADSSGELVYRFSDTVDFPQGAHARTLTGGHCLAWTGVWDATDSSGQDVPVGKYRVRVSVGADTVDGAPADEGGAVEWTVTVEG